MEVDGAEKDQDGPEDPDGHFSKEDEVVEGGMEEDDDDGGGFVAGIGGGTLLADAGSKDGQF